MAVRVACFVAMVLITPYGWYTWVMALGAVFLPYIAVMIANVGSGPPVAAAQTPERALPSAPSAPAAPATTPLVVQIHEAAPPQQAPRRDPAAPTPPAPPSGTGRVFEAGTAAGSAQSRTAGPSPHTPDSESA